MNTLNPKPRTQNPYPLQASRLHTNILIICILNCLYREYYLYLQADAGNRRVDFPGLYIIPGQTTVINVIFPNYAYHHETK